MEELFDLRLLLTRSEYDRLITWLRSARSSTTRTWLRDELMSQMKDLGQDPEPPKYPKYAQ